MNLDKAKLKKNVTKVSVLAFKIASGIILFGLVLILFLYFKPIPNLEIPKIQTLNFNQSQEQFQNQVSTRDTDDINEVCKSRLMHHDQKMAKTIVLFHGFTNCPAQFDQLAPKLFDLGYNIYIPRIPHHGFKNILSDDLENLTATELVNFVAESVQIATGLGDKITLFGLSGGGVLASFGGYYYSQVQTAFISAPLFAPRGYDGWLLPAMINFVTLSKSEFSWWDPATKDKIEGPKYAYPRYSNKAGLAFIVLGYNLKQTIENHQQPQNGKNIILITVENDQAINNELAKLVIDVWSNYPETSLLKYEFGADKVGLHDFIDPNQTKQNINYTYPVIIELLEKM